MAKGYANAPIEAYRAGETIYRLLRTVGRITIAGNSLFTSIALDKPIFANNVTVKLNWANIYGLTNYGTVQVDQNKNVTIYSTVYNTIAFMIPIVSGTTDYAYYIEGDVTISFS